MKVIATLATLLIASLATPAFAQDWDMASTAPTNTLNAQQFVPVGQVASAVASNSGGMQWDTTALTNPNTTAAAETAYMQQIAYQQQQAQKRAQAQGAPVITYGTPNLPVCQTALMTPGGLPQTSLDSFVANAGGNADQIYGDEGTTDIPPFFGFTEGNTIGSGIQGGPGLGLSTGHASGLPSAWTSYY